ncbi:hypothetical protein DPEC_G00098960 [Dallia pectoralis]|uniref:Uncharacterized protein n=1 Tax=Dallia pectoralis TaxID=75939 RepID=A0ACC2GX43_DALPE|nr:hypothetical protein DPEC_G00098960 [Dallia pectoralis]
MQWTREPGTRANREESSCSGKNTGDPGPEEATGKKKQPTRKCAENQPILFQEKKTDFSRTAEEERFIVHCHLVAN